MIATHSVKINGKWYRAGEKIPALNSASESKIPDEVEKETKNYTKTEINRMPIADLKGLAARMEIESSETMSGAELKKALIEAFGL